MIYGPQKLKRQNTEFELSRMQQLGEFVEIQKNWSFILSHSKNIYVGAV